jgi:hypothetical protein
MYDIVFISYNELNAEENYARLSSRFSSPILKRIIGVAGIHSAHIAASKKAMTKMFWVVDGDAQVLDTFNFDYQVPNNELDYVHVWRSQNPVNGLIYGNGGVKLLPRKLTMNMDTSRIDMTTSISTLFKPMPEIANITAFNTDPFSTWRSAFRECVKLASSSIERQNDIETQQRLDTWCTLNDSAPYGFYAYTGALAGKRYGEKNASNKEALSKINDFTWLEVLWLAEKSQLSL